MCIKFSFKQQVQCHWLLAKVVVCTSLDQLVLQLSTLDGKNSGHPIHSYGTSPPNCVRMENLAWSKAVSKKDVFCLSFKHFSVTYPKTTVT